MVKKLKEIKKEIEAKEREEREKKADELLKKVEDLEQIKVEFPTEFKSVVLKSVEWIFNAIAKRKGDHWKLQPDELQALGDSYVALAEKYLPEGLNRFSIEINALLWTTIILSKRLVFK